MSKRFNGISIRCAVIASVLASTVFVRAQVEGNNAVYPASGSNPAASAAYIDASPFFNNVSQGDLDICKTIYGILTGLWASYPTGGAIVDARGIILQSGQSEPIPCSVDPFMTPTPLGSACQGTSTNLVKYPGTILLPASSIAITCTWIMPSNTRIIGEGSGASSVTVLELPTTSGTTFSGQTMIQMCPGPSTCTGISIEHLKLEGQNSTGSNPGVDGIDNPYAGDGSFVNDVNFSDIGQTNATGSVINALWVGGNATYSGPYTNIDFGTPTPPNGCNNMNCVPTACVRIDAQIRGLHGITCTAKSSSTQWPAAAIYLNSYNTSVSDVHVEGFYDGIVVGPGTSGTTSPGVVGITISNVTSANSSNGPVQNAVHICSIGVANHACMGDGPAAISDVMLSQIQTLGPTTTYSNVIEDDNFSNPIGASSYPTLAFVGLYAIGAPVNSGSPPQLNYTRFTTSPEASAINGQTVQITPTWGVGTGVPTNSNTCANGSIFSNTNGQAGSKNTIYVCANGAWSAVGN